MLDPNQCESLEEVFKRIQFNKIDLEATSMNDEVVYLTYNSIIKLFSCNLYIYS